LVPWKGYCVKNNENSSVTIQIPAKEAASGTGKRSEPYCCIREPGDWAVRIKAECRKSADWDNYIGCLSSAENEWDENDFSEAPPIGDYVSLYFPHEDWKKYPDKYTGDFRSLSNQGAYWDFTVKTNITQSKVDLTFEDLDRVPQSFSAILIDESGQIRRDLKKEKRYAFSSGAGETERRLRILIGKEEYVESNNLNVSRTPSALSLLPNYPNPFNASTTIQYTLPSEARISIDVFDMLGRHIIALENDTPKEAGYHSVVWDGRNTQGTSVPSGIYLVHLKAGGVIQQRKVVLTK